MMTNRIRNALFLLLFSVCGWAQQAKVVSFTETMDIIAGDDQRRDLNRQLCALVKVQVVDEITDVEGNMVGPIINHGVEKWVYMAKDSRNMKIHLKNNLPILVKFRDYKITSLKSNRVYVLVINAPRTASVEQPSTVESNFLSMQVTPANADVTIWGNDQQKKLYRPQADGSLRLSLPYGRYYYEVKANGYRDADGCVFVNDENQVQTVTLSAVEGSLMISCPTKKSEFFIDGKRIEKNNNATFWTGQMKPGKYQVEIKCNGYVSRILTAEVRPDQTTKLQVEALLSERDAKKEIVKKNKELERKQKEEEEKKNKEFAKQQEEKKKAEEAANKKTNIANNTVGSKKSDSPKSSSKAKSKTVSSKDKLTFGIVAGYNMASASFDDRYGSDIKSQSGFHVGMTMDVPLVSSFYFSTGLLYSVKGYKYENKYHGVQESANPQYIDIPIQAQYRLLLGGNAALRFQAGPYVGLCVSGKVTDEWDGYGSSLYDESFSSAYTGFDYGLQGGIGVDISGFDIHVNYQMGLEKKYMNKNLMIGIGYRF